MPQHLSERSPDLVVAAVEGVAPEHAWPGEWEALATRSSAPAAFTSRPWIAPWLNSYARTAPIVAIEIRAEARLTGLLWLYRDEDPAHGTRWLAAGSGNSDRLDPLIDARDAAGASRALIDALANLSRTASVELQQVNAASVFARIAANDKRCTVADQEPCLVLDLAGVPNAERMLKKSMRYDLRRSRKLMEEHGGAIEEAVPETVAGLMDALIRLHTARWRARGGTGVLADTTTRDLHHAVARNMAGNGLVLRALRFGDAIVACVYGFRSNGVEMCYLNGFDPEWSWLQPGKLMLAESIDRAIADGLHRFDMLRGREDYKYRWPAIEEPCIRIRIGSSDEKAGRTLDHR